MEWSPLIIAVAPNGARKSKQDHPSIPITPDELALAARQCVDAGACMIHLHVRDRQGRHTLDAGAYRSAVEAITNAVGDSLVIQATSEAVGIYQPEQVIKEIKRLKPEAVSVSLREMIPDSEHLKQVAGYFAWLARERVTPQYILFSDEDVQMYRNLLARGVIPAEPHWLLFVLGRYETGFSSSALSLLPFLTDRQISVPWAVCAFGRAEHQSASCAITLGGHVRVGFENNEDLKRGDRADSNAQLVEQAYEVAQAVGRTVADAHALRALFSKD